MDWSAVNKAIADASNTNFVSKSQRSIGGGDINSAYLLDDGRSKYFVKINSAEHEAMFAAEADGLKELKKPNVIQVPSVVCKGLTGDHCYLVLEYIPFSSGNRSSAEKLGQQLAMLHQTQVEKFGWLRPNTIGLTPQINVWTSSWVDFFRKHRIEFQVALAKKNACNSRLISLAEELSDVLPVFFTDYQPDPSLLHGDLWSGNYAFNEDGEPVIFDPAVYYGDREADMAMTELFGGFPGAFYQAYNDINALDQGYAVRKHLYNLYHVLNHFNLFGGGYQQQAIGLMERLLAEAK